MSETGRRMGYRRLGAAATGLGASAVVAIFLLSSVANAGAALSSGTYWYPYKFEFVEGCAQAHGYPPKFSDLTGHGSEKDSVSAKTCPAYRGGTNVYSEAELDNELNVASPVALTSANNGVNVTWDIKAAASVNGGLTGSTSCPTSSYSYSYFYNYTPYYSYWFNDSSIYGNCEAGANMELFGSTYMISTNSTGSEDGYWYGGFWYNFTDAGVENLTDWFAYSEQYVWVNSTYYPYGLSNYSYSYSYNVTLNNTGSSYSIVMTPTAYLNSTANYYGTPFNSADTYVVYTYVDVSTLALAFGFPGNAHGAASLNAAGTTHHMNLRPLVIW